jgi:hypothetical protein
LNRIRFWIDRLFYPPIGSPRIARASSIVATSHPMERTSAAARSRKGAPTIIIAHTIKGKGVSFMENVAEWHGKAPCKEEAEKALEEIRRCSCEI